MFALLSVKWSRLRDVKNIGKFQTVSVPKVGAVAYERWSLKSASNIVSNIGFKYSVKYSDLTWKILVFWKTGHCGDVVAYERWSQLEVRLYHKDHKFLDD